MSGSSLRRASVVAPGGSYASVASGQSRLPATSTSEQHLNAPGSNRYNPATNTFPPKQPQSMPNPLPLPDYLKQTAYAERLSQNAKSQQAKSPSYSSLPTPPSSLTLPGRLLQVHRGAVFDATEPVPPEDDSIIPLPSRWDEQHKWNGIEVLNDGSEVKFIGPQKVNDNEAAAVRADNPMSPQCGIYYYECKIVSKSKDSLIGIGFCGAKVAMNRLPGWEPESWGYHGDDGNAFCSHGPGKSYGPQFAANDVIGCGVNFHTNTAFFTKNGVHLGTAFRELKQVKLYPSVGMKRLGEHVRVNFGQEEFMFDIISYMREEKATIYAEINQFPSANLRPPLDESALIQAFVSSYLAHDGYVDTARAFAEDVQKEARALATSGRRGSIRPLDIKEDRDAINRQKIRTAILAGNVDKALDLTNQYYPTVFKENEMTYFRLKCRKLVEMIGVVSEASTTSTTYNNSNSKLKQYQSDSHHEDHMEDFLSREMEIDDQSSGAGEWERLERVDRMEVEDEEDGISHVKGPLDAAVQYAQALRVEFQTDKRPEIRKALEESFSLVAYQDPKNSVLSHLFNEDGRIAVAEELNSAILVSLGKSSVAPLERLVQQATALVQELSEDGGAASFVNLHSDFLKTRTF